MFEFEQAASTCPPHPEIAAQIRTVIAMHDRRRILSFSTLSWGEHCTECAFPTCYTSCTFYQPRQDGRCRRFDYGIVKVPYPRTWLPYGAYLKFRNWSMLWAQGNATQLPPVAARTLGVLGGLAWAVANPIDQLLRRLTGRRRLSLVMQSLRRRIIRKIGSFYHRFPRPDTFLVEVYNPVASPVRLRLWILGRQGPEQRRFEWGETAPAGFSSFRIPMEHIEALIDPGLPFNMGLTLEREEGKSLYVCSAHFVRLHQPPVDTQVTGPTKKVKVVVWDLDHTMWEGVLVESREGNFPPLRDGVRGVLEALDRRGILNSIASKNSPDDALQAIKHHGISNYFVVPQIHWGPKSQSIRAIAAELNLGLDTFAFIDDQPFEREEVSANVPDLRIYDACELLELLGREEFAGDVSGDGTKRRELYQTETRRQQELKESGADYDQFLASCDLKAEIHRASRADLPRILDIVQRTNQLNTSGRRYEMAELEDRLESSDYDCFLVDCEDRYGSYGRVGFIIFHRRDGLALLTDCMFSCRIQGKRFDEAVLRFLANHYAFSGCGHIAASYTPMPRNAPALEMLKRAGFQTSTSSGDPMPLPGPFPLELVSYVDIKGSTPI